MGRRVARKRGYFLAPHIPAPTTVKCQRACPAAAAGGLTSTGKSGGNPAAARAARRPARATTLGGLLGEGEKARGAECSVSPAGPAEKMEPAALSAEACCCGDVVAVNGGISDFALSLATTMFVRFRETPERLQVSLVETRRSDGGVKYEHVASCHHR